MKIASDKSYEWMDDHVNAYIDAFQSNLLNGHSLVNGLDEDRLKNDPRKATRISLNVLNRTLTIISVISKKFEK